MKSLALGTLLSEWLRNVLSGSTGHVVSGNIKLFIVISMRGTGQKFGIRNHYYL